jgi:hypothetical protein
MGFGLTGTKWNDPNGGFAPPYVLQLSQFTPHHPMNFSALTFSDHSVIKGGTKALYTFPNNWTVSIVSGPKDSGLYGIIGEDTFEVAIIRPNGNMLEDVLSYQTPGRITSLMHLIEML